MGIKLGIIITTGDPRMAAELAALAEEHAWDGVFTWDGIAIGSMDTFDPWVVMAAMAMRTERIRLGAIVTPCRLYASTNPKAAFTALTSRGHTNIRSSVSGSRTTSWTADLAAASSLAWQARQSGRSGWRPGARAA